MIKSPELNNVLSPSLFLPHVAGSSSAEVFEGEKWSRRDGMLEGKKEQEMMLRCQLIAQLFVQWCCLAHPSLLSCYLVMGPAQNGCRGSRRGCVCVCCSGGETLVLGKQIFGLGKHAKDRARI